MGGRGRAAAIGALLLAIVLAAVLLGHSDAGRDQPGSPAATSSRSAGSTPSRSAPPAPSLSLADWRPVMDDDFDSLDRARWEVLDGTAHQNEESNLFAANVSTADGLLRIQARRQQTTTAVGGTRDYTSGYLVTTPQASLSPYFRLEIRAKVPFSQGMWAAPGWLRPLDRSAGEIDAVETYGADRRDPRVVQTIHGTYGPGQQQSPRPFSFAQVGDPTGTAWHTYVVEKTRGSISMWVDGVASATWRSGDPSWFDTYYEAGKSWDLRLNLQVGSGQSGREDNHPDATTNWSDPAATALLVDYVKVWAPAP